MTNFTEIIPGLWMGGSFSPVMPSGFDAVVCCREVTDWTLIGVPFLHLPMVDGPACPDAWLLKSGEAFLDASVERSLRKVLVHCAEGHNRSGLVVAYYLSMHGYTPRGPQGAIDIIRQKRPGALTNQVFVDYLLSL